MVIDGGDDGGTGDVYSGRYGDDDGGGNFNVINRTINEIFKLLSSVWSLTHFQWYGLERLLRHSHRVTERNTCYQTAR